MLVKGAIGASRFQLLPPVVTKLQNRIRRQYGSPNNVWCPNKPGKFSCLVAACKRQCDNGERHNEIVSIIIIWTLFYKYLTLLSTRNVLTNILGVKVLAKCVYESVHSTCLSSALNEDHFLVLRGFLFQENSMTWMREHHTRKQGQQ